jgi:predicted short-subunit dehydrogenase-like oxidoreductase (DUF2520 family)
MKIVLIGSGNVASVLGRLMQQSGHEVVQVISRTKENAQALAAALKCTAETFSGNYDTTADLYVVAISDSALHNLHQYIKLPNKLVVHTAGSVAKEVLKEVSTTYGVLYPLQSFRKELDYVPHIPFLVDGSNDEATQTITQFAKTLSSTVQTAGDEERLKLHVAGVVVNNFSNHLYSLAENFCSKEGVDFDMLVPLIQETAQRTQYFLPQQMQTGPAHRKDTFTLDKHLRLLTNHPKLKYLYLKFTESIMNP